MRATSLPTWPAPKSTTSNQVLSPLHRFHSLEGERGVASTALAERVAEDESTLALGLTGGEHLARDRERGVLEVAAADGARGLRPRRPTCACRVRAAWSLAFQRPGLR
jgi:hypothetical protein